MALEFTPKTWKDGEEGGTPIVAEELNRIEQGINQLTEMLNKVKSYVYSNPVANLLSTDNELPLAASMGKQLKGEIDALNTDLTNTINDLNGIKIIRKTYSNVSSALTLDCFPDKNIHYWVIGNIGLSNTNERTTFETALSSSSTVNTLKLISDTSYYLSIERVNNSIVVTPQNVSSAVEISVQAICIPYFNYS